MLDLLEKNCSLSLLGTLGDSGFPPVAAKTPPSGHIMLMSTLVAVGVLVLFIWAVIRSGRREPLSLSNAPGRPSCLGWPHLAVIVVYGLLNLIQAFALALAGSRPRSAVLDRASIQGQIVFTLVILMICLVVAQRCFTQGIFRGLGLSLRRWFVDSGRGIAGFLAIFPVCLGLEALGIRLLPEKILHRHDLLEFITGNTSVVDVLLAFVVAVILAPLFEEVLYRGLLQSALKNVTRSAWKAIFISAAFFAFIHMKVSPEPMRLVGVEGLAPLFALAVVLGYNYERTGRLWPSIVVHMLFNMVVMLVAVMESGKNSETQTVIVNIIHSTLCWFN